MATTDFSLPDSPPPGNTFPSAAGTMVTLVKGQPRAVVVELKELGTPRASREESQPKTKLSASKDTTRTETPSRDASGTPTSDRRTKPARKQPQLTIQTGGSSDTSPPQPSHTSSVTLREDGNGEMHHLGADDGAESEFVHVDQSATDETPVMRSMFPQFDPQTRLSRQDLAPAIELLPPPPPLPSVLRSARSYSPSLGSPPLPVPDAHHRSMHSPPSLSLHSPPLQSPWMGATVPTARLAEEDPTVSTPEELLDLWSLANGQLCPEASDMYSLALECSSLARDCETMTFASSVGPLYLLSATNTTVTLTRRHPLDAAPDLTIATPSLRLPSTTSPLLATIVPALAELLALDQAATVAETNGLTRADATALQAEALHRARKAEAAALLWDSDSGTYFFTIPALANPTAPMPQALAVAIQPGKSIALLDPTRNPLLSLSLNDACLTVHTPAVVALSGSLYTLDVLLAVLGTLLLHLHRHTALLTPYAAPVTIPHFDPPPRAAVAPSRLVSRASRRSKAPTVRSTTSKASKPHWLARASRGSKAPTSVYSSPYLGSPAPKDLEAAFSTDLEAALSSTRLHPSLSNPYPAVGLAHPIPALPEAGVAPELRKATTGVDLSRFQAFDLSDPELGGGTRVVLRVLYWAFGVLVWVLGVAVGVIAAAVVAMGGCLGGKREAREGRIDGGREG